MSDWEDFDDAPIGGVGGTGEERESGLYINNKLVSTIKMDGKNVTKITDEDGKVLFEVSTAKVDIYIEDMQDEDSTVTVNGVTKTATSEKTLAFQGVDTTNGLTISISRTYKGTTGIYINDSEVYNAATPWDLDYELPANTKGEVYISMYSLM